jgi:hypothetical protein
MSEELKACSHCGANAELVTKYKDFAYFVECTRESCLVSAHADTEDEAIRIWNTRPVEDQLRAEITRLEGLNETALRLLTQYGDKADEMLNLQQKLYPEYERLTAENEKLRAQLAAYVGAGRATEGLDSNIPY